MPRIFISYRREDSAGYAGHLYDTLCESFGRDAVFMDVDNLQPGQDFVDAIRRRLAECDVLLTIIGRRWVTATDADGRRRLDDEGDFVRLEVEAAIERQIRIIPVLVDGASMPRRQDLPASLQPLATRHAIEISDDRRAYDIDRLLHSLDPSAAAHPSAAITPSHDRGSSQIAAGFSWLAANWRWPVALLACGATWSFAGVRAWEKWDSIDVLLIWALSGLLASAVTTVILWLLLRNKPLGFDWKKFAIRSALACTLIWGALAQGARSTALVAVIASIGATLAIWRTSQAHPAPAINTRTISWKAIFAGIAVWGALGFQPMAGALDELALLNLVIESGVALAIVVSVWHVRRWWRSARGARSNRDLAVAFVLLLTVMLLWGGVGGRMTNNESQLVAGANVTVSGPTFLANSVVSTCKSDDSGLFHCMVPLPIPGEYEVRVSSSRHVDRELRVVLIPPLRTTIESQLSVFSLETLTIGESWRRVQPPWPFSSGAIRDIFR